MGYNGRPTINNFAPIFLIFISRAMFSTLRTRALAASVVAVPSAIILLTADSPDVSFSSSSSLKFFNLSGLTATASCESSQTVGQINTEANDVLAQQALESKVAKTKRHNAGMKIFAGNGNLALGTEVCKLLGINLGRATVGSFADGEVNIQIHENVRGKDCYILQPTSPPVNNNIMEVRPTPTLICPPPPPPPPPTPNRLIFNLTQAHTLHYIHKYITLHNIT